MIVKVQSMLTGNFNERDIDVTPDQLKAWYIGRLLVQEAFPGLSKEDREFLISGSTPEEWEAAFPPEE